MLTKAQKQEQVALGGKKLKESKSLIFADFTGAPTKDVNTLKTELRKAGATFKVIKKRLLKIALKEAGIEFDPSTFKAPIATVFAENDLNSVAGPVYKFSKELAKRKIEFKIVGAYDGEAKKVLNSQEFAIIAKLPSREVLLAQVIGAMTGPLRAFMYIVGELAKKAPATPAKETTPAPVVEVTPPAPAV